MSINTIDKLASPDEFGDDRNDDVARERRTQEVRTLEEIYRLSPVAKTDVDTDVEGARTIFVETSPRRMAGHLALEHSLRASTRNFAAGAGDERVMSPSYAQQRTHYLGKAAITRRRVQGFPVRPGR